MTTLQELLGGESLSTIREKVFAKLQAQGLPTTDWTETGIERSIAEMVSLALEDLLVSGLPAAVGGGFVDYAKGDWLTFLSSQRYNNERVDPTYTLGTIRLTNSTSSPISISANQLWFLFPSGNKYNGPLTGGTIPANGTLDITVQSESINHSVLTSDDDTDPLVNYVDASGVSIQMISSLAGVTATNPAPSYSAVSQVGNGSGTVTPGGSPSGSHSVTLRIDITGQVGGTLSYSYSVDGGAYTTGQTASTITNIGGYGINVTLANGAGTPSFISGTTYTFTTPGTWITQQGTDAESDTTLAARDKNKWPSLATLEAIPGSPTLGFYDLLAREASSQVTQTLVQTDATINNKVNVYIAGQAGVLPSTVVSAVQAYLDQFFMLTDLPVVASPTPLTITLGGLTITVKQAFLATAQASLQAALQSYFASVGINAKETSGVIRHAHIIQIIEEMIGITDVSDTTMTINGAASSLSLPTIVGAVQLPQWSQQIATAATWVTV